MFESIMNFFKKMTKKEEQTLKSKDAAKERLHLVLMQDRANVSVDFLELMKQEIIDVIKKYIEIDEKEIDVMLNSIAKQAKEEEIETDRRIDEHLQNAKKTNFICTKLEENEELPFS